MIVFLGFVLVMVSLHTGQAGWAWTAAAIDAAAVTVLLFRVGAAGAKDFTVSRRLGPAPRLDVGLHPRDGGARRRPSEVQDGDDPRRGLAGERCASEPDSSAS
jgi:hypothetical protein